MTVYLPDWVLFGSMWVCGATSGATLMVMVAVWFNRRGK